MSYQLLEDKINILIGDIINDGVDENDIVDSLNELRIILVGIKYECEECGRSLRSAIRVLAQDGRI